MEGGWCELMFASKNGHAEVVKILLENGAQVDLQNKYGILCTNDTQVRMDIMTLLKYC